jgi:DNA-binding NtrC family response regulator
MREAHFAIVNCHPSHELARCLVAILRRHFVAGGDTTLPDRYDHIFDPQSPGLRQMLANTRLHFVFIVLEFSEDDHATSLFLQHTFAKCKHKIFAVVENPQSDGLLRLLRLGVSDFIISPLREVEIIPRIQYHLDSVVRDTAAVRELKLKLGLEQFIGENEIFIQCLGKLPTLSKCDVSVFITGETGTGKELCARTIHYLSRRSDKPFVPVNCGAIPRELFENEFFGHTSGAFTGASATSPGLIAEADDGTLFLDEIDCLDQQAQVKLLRFLQEGEYRSLGSSIIKKANVRIISATNADIEHAVKTGDFRRDLIYRLNTVPLWLPPLRERREDILLLAQHFLAKHCGALGKQISGFSSDATAKLLSYEWPGNVRELEHIVERAVVFGEGRLIHGPEIELPLAACHDHALPFQIAKREAVWQFEQSYIQDLLVTYRGNISRAAEAARKNRRAFWELIRKHAIEPCAFKTASPPTRTNYAHG